MNAAEDSPHFNSDFEPNVLRFSGKLLQRGFWLYVWEISAPSGASLYYVGRTGDSSSSKAQSPFNRMGQHLGFKKESNALRRALESRAINPEHCEFRLVACGPLLPEGFTSAEHRVARDQIAPMEKAVADAMQAAGYEVMNKVNCRLSVNKEALEPLIETFSLQLPKLAARQARR